MSGNDGPQAPADTDRIEADDDAKPQHDRRQAQGRRENADVECAPSTPGAREVYRRQRSDSKADGERPSRHDKTRFQGQQYLRILEDRDKPAHTEPGDREPNEARAVKCEYDYDRGRNI